MADGSLQWDTRTVKAVGRASLLHVEAMESRVLLSAYTPSDVGYFWSNASGANPRATLAADSSGNFYGTTTRGGTYGAGEVFEIARGSSQITRLASFNGADGLDPYSGVTLDASGNVYGTAFNGGTSDYGTVFEIANGSNAITAIASFSGTNGRFPGSGVILDDSGNLFGTTEEGGANGPYGFGEVFEIAKGSNTVTTLASFDGPNGKTPCGNLAMDATGNLYGATYYGGPWSSPGTGTVFEIANGSSTITPVANFDQENGEYPNGGVTLDASGNLFGTTYSGGAYGAGTVFEAVKSSSTLMTLSFKSSTVGSNPYAGVTLDASGNLFGATSGGNGAVFEVAKGFNAIKSLGYFGLETGSTPYGGITVDSTGNLFGTTYTGGSGNGGTVYEVPSGSNTIAVVAPFDPLGSSPGTYPGGVTLDAHGDLYGLTYQGDNGKGTVYEIASGSNTADTILSFNGTDGATPYGQLSIDAAGNLYGTASSGGENNSGTVFEIASGSSAITTIASFNGADGTSPMGGVALDPMGNLYGVTSGGGQFSDGTVFEVANGSNTITSLANFNGADGANPYAGVTLDATGDLFGTAAAAGPDGDGTVFELVKGSSTLADLGGFSVSSSGSYPNGQFPTGRVALDPAGNLYGTAAGGGAAGDGTVFEIAKGSTAETILASFDGSNGQAPEGGSYARRVWEPVRYDVSGRCGWRRNGVRD